jgi:SAM-dependent methyltransferase
MGDRPVDIYTAPWTREESLDSLNSWIHDFTALDKLGERAAGYRNTMFSTYYPEAAPKAGARALELGPGVGWIMEAMLEAFPISEMVGLDISENMVRRAKERFPHPKACFELYDGLHFPFPDASFDVVYSCAAIQHIERHYAFFVFKELHRVLKPGGHGVVHLLSIHHLPHSYKSYEEECWDFVRGEAPITYYSFDELESVLVDQIGADDFDVRSSETGSFFVHFSKESGRRYRRPELAYLGYLHRPAREEQLLEIVNSRAWRLAEAVRSSVRSVAPVGTYRGAVLSRMTRALTRR